MGIVLLLSAPPRLCARRFGSGRRPGWVHPRQNALRLVVYTGGEPLEGVQPMGDKDTGQKWGSLSVSEQEELQEAFLAVEESHKRITTAIKRNERTSSHAKLDESTGYPRAYLAVFFRIALNSSRIWARVCSTRPPLGSLTVSASETAWSDRIRSLSWL